MATTRDRRVEVTRTITLLVWRDALLGWGIPLFLCVLIGLTAFLAVFHALPSTTGILTLGILLLVLVAFYSFKNIFTGEIQPRVKRITLGVGIAWIVITCIQLYLSVRVGSQVLSSVVTPENQGIQVSLGKRGTAYEVVFQGGFLDGTQRKAVDAKYHLRLEKEGKNVTEFAGTISEHWVRRRLGRRGRVMTRELQNRVLHRLISPGEGTYHLKVIHLDPQLKPMLDVTFYYDTYPERTLWALDILLLTAAYAVQGFQPGNGISLVLVTASAIAFVLGFRTLNPPPHGYYHMIGSAIFALIVGPIVGSAFSGVLNFLRRRIGNLPSG